MREAIAAAILAASLVVLPFTARACDLALSLALDVSGSLNPEQQRQIRVGTAAALTNMEVVRSFAGNSVYLQIFEWAERPRILVDWRQIGNSDDMADLATAMVGAPPPRAGDTTHMQTAMLFALDQFRKLKCDRSVLDIMTDGFPTDRPEAARENFSEGEHEINVLFIGSNVQALARMDGIKFGYGAFVQPVADVDGYQHAMLRKLLREVSMNVPNRSEG